MGVVYLVDKPGSSERYALKTLGHADGVAQEMRARLGREARALEALDAPHIARVIDVDTAADVPYVVMRYVDGAPLDAAVTEGGLGEAAAREHGAQIAAALEAVHRAGIVHRDLKPNNVILGPAGATLVDFGIASLGEESTTALTREGTVLGTLAWLAPEVIAGGEASERSDVFGLGLVVGFMLLGRHPFGSGRPETLMYRIMHEGPDLQGAPPDLARAIEAALSRDPEQRPSAAQLRQALAGEVQLASPPRTRRRRRRTAVVLGALAAAVVAAVAVGRPATDDENPATIPSLTPHRRVR